MSENKIIGGFHLIALVVAAICLIGSLLLHINFDNYLDKLEPEEIKAKLEKNPLTTAYFWSSLLKEIAFALIIAIFIALGIERAAKHKQFEAVRQHLDEVSEDVFKATLKRSAPPEIVDSVFQNIYTSKLLRKNCRLTIRLQDFPSDCVGAEDFLLYQITHHYEVHSLVDHEIDYDLQIYGPEPHLIGLRDHIPRITVKINDRTLNSDIIGAGETAIPNSGFEERFKTIHKISPRDKLDVSTTHSMAKKRDDSECWITLMPQIGMELTVDNATNQELFWDVDSLFIGEMSPITPGLSDAPYTARRASFTTKQAFLPFQGISLNWRPQRGGAAPDCR